MIQFITELKDKVLNGERITFEEAQKLIHIPIAERETIEHLIESAHELTEKISGNDADLCSLINAKSGDCTEDCGFCAQSSHSQTGIDTYELVDEATILAGGKAAEERGVDRFCVVTATGTLTDEQFEQVLSGFRMLREKTNLKLEASVGNLSKERLLLLKEQGVTRINHNLETSPNYYPQIVTTHTFQDRFDTIQNVRDCGMEVCSGGIIGMGESKEDRIQLAFELAKLDVEVMPINVLDPRPGTALEKAEPLDPMEAIKTIAVFRFILPKTCLKLGGGREVNLGPYQRLAARAGANGLIVGGYLTTPGGSIEEDRRMMEEAGYNIPKIPEATNN